ncbi:MAG: MBL fold metallo-hydrolase [bacterium]|nr:MBL fold metallo-hydrolase [bacterium]
MDITWYGHSCFRIVERGQISVITDPYSDIIGLPVPKLKGDVVTISHHSPGHANGEAVKGATHFLTGPGEYEIGGVFVTGVAMHQLLDEGGYKYNVAYVVQYGSLSVLHLGDLSHVPSQSAIEALGEVNVALVPVGGGGALKAAQAAEVIALIEPHYIVPMHYALPELRFELDPVDKFLKEMGVSKVQEEDVLRVSEVNLPEQPQVVVLNPQR